MDFKELAYVLAIAKYQNITRAADSLYVTQPTLTRFLQNLEKELGQKLFRSCGAPICCPAPFRFSTVSIPMYG